MNSFKHLSTVTLSDGTVYPYAFGPNQGAMLCQLQGWEFWEYEEKVFAALLAASHLAGLVSKREEEPDAYAAALQAARRSLFNDPVFLQNFYFAAIKFGHELEGLGFDLTPGQLGVVTQQEATVFLPIISHYSDLQTQRFNVANARPISAPQAGAKTTKQKTKAR